MIETKELICGYGKFAVTKELNLRFNEGIYLIYGPNGSGKTTILKTISGLLRPIKGKVYFCGRDIYRERRALKNLFYLSEKINPPEFLKTKDYLGLVFSFYGLELRRTIEKVKEFLNQFDLGWLINANISNLSQGQRRLVQLISAYGTARKVNILDDPLLGIDIETYGEIVKNLLTKLNGVTIASERTYDFWKFAKKLKIEKGEVKEQSGV